MQKSASYIARFPMCDPSRDGAYLEEDEPKGGGNSEQDEYSSGDSSTKLNHKENKCLKREREREEGREGGREKGG